VLDDLDALLLHDRQGLVGMVRALLGTRFPETADDRQA
jgi:hypothetical protein